MRFCELLALGVAHTACVGPPDVVAVEGPSFELPADRRIPWVGQVGVAGDIPTGRSICADVTAAPWSARGDGSADDAPAIQAAIDACPAGQAVFVPAGRYRLSRGLVISKSITLRGAGPTLTTLLMEGSDTFIGARPTRFESTAWVSGFTAGATSVQLSRTDSLSVGQELVLDQLNDTRRVNPSPAVPLTCARNGLQPLGGGSRVELQLVRITGIRGQQVDIAPALYQDRDASLSPEAFWWSGANGPGNLQRAGIESLKVDGTASNQGENHLLDFQFCSECWLKDVEVAASGRAATRFLYALRSEVRDSHFHDGRPPVGPERFGVRLDNTSAMRIENNVFKRIVTPVAFTCANSGAVVAYNYAEELSPGSTWLFSFVATLAGHNQLHLLEGNVAPAVSFSTRVASASEVTLLRNRIAGLEPGKVNQTVPLVVQAWNRRFNLLGNVLGWPGHHDRYEQIPNDTMPGATAIYVLGFSSADLTQADGRDTEVLASLVRHGNRDSVSGEARWVSGLSHRLPDSLYLSSRPPYWDSSPWPPIGPQGQAGPIPAQTRAAALP